MNNMLIEKLWEQGYESALKGLALNKNQPERAMRRVAEKLCKADPGTGHDQFLRHICVSFMVTATLKWWKQMDKYHFIETQSESTMHTLLKKGLSTLSFDDSTPTSSIKAFEGVFLRYPVTYSEEEVYNALPSGFLQTRQLTTNYAQLKTIIKERSGHKLQEWHWFINATLSSLEHPELLHHILFK